MQVVGDTLAVISVSNGRRIAGIFPDVTIEESHQDTLTITEHPVEQGAPITDHAFKNAAELTMRVAWSNSTAPADRRAGDVRIEDISDAYSYLLKLQASRQPFDVITGKRAYKNMLIRSLAASTDRRTSQVLEVVVGFRQIIVVSASVVNIQATNQKKPEITSSIESTGTKSPIPLTDDLISKPLQVLEMNGDGQ